MSSLQVDNIQSYNANPPLVKNVSGNQVGTFCRAWVNFNGQGTVAIRASFNVSSITDNGVGDYTVNFTTAMVDANYAVSGGARYGDGGVSYTMRVVSISSISTLASAMQTSSVRLGIAYSNNGNDDIQVITVAIFR